MKDILGVMNYVRERDIMAFRFDAMDEETFLIRHRCLQELEEELEDAPDDELD
jgi:hypothetical protein